MASSALALPPSYHQSTPPIKKNKLEMNKVRSEDELLKFFLHGSYDVQRGNIHSTQIEENSDQIISIQDETDEQKINSRCMFEETYMINISVKQPNTKPSSKQIDVRIEKAASDNPTEKPDEDEISSIFDEEDNDDEIDSVIFNEINSTSSETPTTKLTLADMINKTLTTIPAISMDNLHKISQKNNWYIEQQNAIKTRKTSEEILLAKKPEKIIKTPPPPLPSSAAIQQPILTTNIKEDEKLFEYLDYLETKEESNQQSQKSPSQTKSTKSTSKIPSKISPQESIPIIDLEQLCRSLTVNDLKDELIRKKIYELKILIDEQHKKPKSQIPLVKPRKDNLPILIAMPPVVQQRRRTIGQPTSTISQSKPGHSQVSYNANYQEMLPNYNIKQYSQRQIAPTNSTRKYHYT
jgi:hypothetical protein